MEKRKKSELQARAAEILNTMDEMKASGINTPETRVRFAEMLTELETLGDAINLRRSDDQYARWTETASGPTAGHNDLDDSDFRDATRIGGGRAPESNMSYRTPGDKKDYRSIFGTPRKDWHHRDLSFFEAFFSGRAHPGLSEMRAMNEGSGAAGGFLLPSETAEQVFNVSVGQEIVLPRSNVIRFSSDSIEVPAFEISNMSSSLFGGYTASWTQEAAEMTNANPTVRKVSFVARKQTGFVKISNELLADIGRRSNDLLSVIGNGIAWFRDQALFQGDGAGKPKGVLKSACKISIPKENGQAADTIIYENLVKALAAMHPDGVSRCVWVAHPSTLPALLSLSIAVGTGGSHFPILTATSGNYELLTRPLILSPHMNVLGDEGDIALIDFSQFCVALREDIRIDTSGHIYFNTDETAIRVIVRYDAACLWDKSMVLPDGSTQVSPVVTIAAR